MTAEEIVKAIHAELSGKEWNSDTLERVADILNRNGHVVFDIEEEP